MSPGWSSRAITAACATSACRSSAASISPGSMRKPRTFTCASARPRKSKHPVGAPARQIAGAVHAAPGRPERIGHEPLRRQPGASEIAARQPRARDVKLARNPGRHRLQASVQHIDLRVPDRTADRHRSVIRITGLNFIGRAAARRFSWPVVNDELGLRNMPAPGSNVRATHALATDHDAMGQSCKAFNGRRVVQNVEVRGSKLEQTEIARGPVAICQDLELFLLRAEA